MKTIFKTAAVGAVFLAGCMASDQVPRGNYNGVMNCDSSAATAKADSAETAPEPVHEGPWTWEELAIRAGQRSTAMKEGRLDALVKRLKATQDVAWKDPEFRFTNEWSDDDDDSWKSDGAGGLKNHGHRDGDGWSRQYGVRFYVPNPFINHYVAAKGDAAVRASEARAETEAYAIYTEVKMLCAEYLKAKRNAELFAKREAAVLNLRQAVVEQRENRVLRSPFDVIQAETEYRKSAMQLASLERAANHLKRTIARLAQVPVEGFEIAGIGPELPDPAALDEAMLTEIAFARRPDLARAVAERDAAEAAVGAAKAAYVPWFRFVQGSYRRGHEHDWESSSAGEPQYGRGRSADWQVELAITIPVFTWCGDSVKISREIRDCAEERLASLYDDVREEIRVALEGYRRACERDDSAAHEKFVADMELDIEECANSGAALASEASKSRQALVDYQLLYNGIHSGRVEAALQLESVIGGPIPVQ